MYAKKLNLRVEPISTQIIPRDRHAYYFSVLAIIAGSMERIATEIRNLQKTELQEVEEFFDKKQKGSSAMPHKRNPIVTERITGMSRLLRANAMVGLENIALWHERDISHSSVERIIIPDSTILLDYMLNKMIYLIDNLLVYPKNMIKNINKSGGLIFSQEVLLALINKGMTREDAYALVQKNAMEVWEEGLDFKKILLEDNSIHKYLSESEIKELFDMNKIKKNIYKVFDRLDLK